MGTMFCDVQVLIPAWKLEILPTMLFKNINSISELFFNTFHYRLLPMPLPVHYHILSPDVTDEYT
jgi:hypothetical protein